MTAPLRALLWVLVIVLAAAAGFIGYGLTDRARFVVRIPSPTPMPPRASGNDAAGGESPLLPAPRGIPVELPEIELTDAQGKPRSLSQWEDQPLIVNFWATWCEPCRREIPLLKELRRRHADQRLEIVGIAVDLRDAVLKYANDVGIEYPILIGEQDGLDAIEAFGMEPVFPFSVFSDRRRRIVAVRVGELHADEADFILAEVKLIDSGTLELPEARQRIAERLRELSVARAKTETVPE